MGIKLSLDTIDSATSSIEIKTAAGQALAINGSGAITISNTSFDISDGGGSITVDATQLDIDDLSSAVDNVEIRTAAGQALAINGSGAITISNTSFDISDGGGSITVDALDLDIRDLTQTDEITAYQGGAWTFVLDNISSWKNTVESVGTTAVQLVSTSLASRTSVTFQNTTNKDLYIGPSNTVTTSGATQGFKIPKGSSADVGFDSSATIYGIVDSGTADILVTEFAT